MIEYCIDWGSIKSGRAEKWRWNQIRILELAYRIFLYYQFLYWLNYYQHVQTTGRKNYFKIAKTLFCKSFQIYFEYRFTIQKNDLRSKRRWLYFENQR